MQFVIGGAFGIAVGYYLPRFLLSYESKKIRSRARSKIEKQDMKYIMDGKHYDIEKDMEGQDPFTPIKVKKEVTDSNLKLPKVTKKIKKEVKKVVRKPGRKSNKTVKKN